MKLTTLSFWVHVKLFYHILSYCGQILLLHTKFRADQTIRCGVIAKNVFSNHISSNKWIVCFVCSFLISHLIRLNLWVLFASSLTAHSLWKTKHLRCHCKVRSKPVLCRKQANERNVDRSTEIQPIAWLSSVHKQRSIQLLLNLAAQMHRHSPAETASTNWV